MSPASPRRKTFPTLHSTTSPPTTAANPSNVALQRETNNASPPTVPYTMNDMNIGINHIISEAMVREQLSGASPSNNNTPTTTPTEDSITEYESPPKRLLKGLTTTCDGTYGQQLSLTANALDSVPVEDVQRWKEFRRKQKTAAAKTEIDVNGFPVSAEGQDNVDDNDSVQKQTLSLATSASNSEVGTEIASNTAQYLMKQSNIKARQLMSSSEENEDDSTEDWGPPVNVGDDWGSSSIADASQKVDNSKIVDDCVAKDDSVDNTVMNQKSTPLCESQHVLPQTETATAETEVACASKSEVPTMDEVHKFMQQLKQKSAVGRERNSKYAMSSDNSNNSRQSKPSLSLPTQPSIETSESKDSSITSSTDVQKSLMEHRERMKQQKIEGERKRQEFDARLQLLRSQLHDEAADARMQLLRSKLHDDNVLTVRSSGIDSIASKRIVSGGMEDETRENNINLNLSVPALPGARWSGGLAVWSPSNNGVGVGKSSSATKSSSDSNLKQQNTAPLQILPQTGIGIDEDDFSFSPVDVKSVANKRAATPKEAQQPSPAEQLELFSEAYGGEAAESKKNDQNIYAAGNDEAMVSKFLPSAVVQSRVIHSNNSERQSRKVNLLSKSPPSDVSAPISNSSTNITESDKGGGVGSGYGSGFGEKSIASSVNVELGYGAGLDPPLGSDDSSGEKGKSLLGTVAGSTRQTRKSNSSIIPSESMITPVIMEPTGKDAPFERKQLDPDGIGWQDIDQTNIDIAKLATYSTEPTTPSSSVRKVTHTDLGDSDDEQMCPDNIFSPKNNVLPPTTPRMTPQARDGQLNYGSHFTPRSKALPTPRATPRTARAANLSSARKFGFADSPDLTFKLNENPIARRDERVAESMFHSPSKAKFSGRLKVHIPSNDMAPRSTPRGDYTAANFAANHNSDEVQRFGRPEHSSNHDAIEELQSKFESNTFGIDHLQKSLQNIREQKMAGTPKSPFKSDLLDSPKRDPNTPSRIYLDDRELVAMSSLETDTHVSIDYSLNKGVSVDNEATIGDTTLGASTMDTRKALRYAKKLESLNESEDHSTEDHEEEDTTSIVALRRKAFEGQGHAGTQKCSGHQGRAEEKDKISLTSKCSVPSASTNSSYGSRDEAGNFLKKPPRDHGSISQSSPGKTSVVASIKERIAAYGGQNSKNGKPSPYRLSSQSKTFQVRVGGQVKSINIQSPARKQDHSSSINEPPLYSPGTAVKKELSSPAVDNNGSQGDVGAYPSINKQSVQLSQAPWPVTPIDTAYDLDDEEDGITLSPTISEVSGLTLQTCLANEPVAMNECERTMTPIARLRHRKQASKFSYEHIDASTPKMAAGGNRSSRRDQIVSRIRETSSNGNLWQKRNVVTEVSHSTSASGDTPSKSKGTTMGYRYAKPAARGKVAEKIAMIDGGSLSGDSENMSVVDRVAMIDRHSRQQRNYKVSQRSSTNDDPTSSLATRDCLRVD